MEVTGAYWGTEAGFQDAIKPLTDLWRTKNVSPDDMGIRGLGKSAVHERQWPEMLLYMANDDHLEPAARTAMSQLSPREFAKASYEGGVWPEIFSYVSTEDKTTFVEPGQEDVNMDGENARVSVQQVQPSPNVKY